MLKVIIKDKSLKPNIEYKAGEILKIKNKSGYIKVEEVKDNDEVNCTGCFFIGADKLCNFKREKCIGKDRKDGKNIRYIFLEEYEYLFGEVNGNKGN